MWVSFLTDLGIQNDDIGKKACIGNPLQSNTLWLWFPKCMYIFMAIPIQHVNVKYSYLKTS